MTTIAVSVTLGIMASDSQVTVESKGITYPATKIVRKGAMLIGAAGHAGDCTRFLKWAQGKFQDKEPKWAETEDEDKVIGIILDKNGISIWNDGDPEPERIEAETFAIGSGGKAARVAMLLGKTPEEAVVLACQVDPYSAAPVQTLKLGD